MYRGFAPQGEGPEGALIHELKAGLVAKHTFGKQAVMDRVLPGTLFSSEVDGQREQAPLARDELMLLFEDITILQ